MIKKNENLNVKKRVKKRSKNSKRRNSGTDLRLIIIAIILIIISIFVIIRSAKMVKILGTATKNMIDVWSGEKTSSVEVLEKKENIRYGKKWIF